MAACIWGMTDSGFVVVGARPVGRGLEVIGLPSRRTHTTRDRLWSALLNSGVCPGRPDARLEVRPPIRAGNTAGLDLALALAALAVSGALPPPEYPILAIGRLRLDGSLAGVDESVRDTPREVRHVLVATGSEVEVDGRDREVDVTIVSGLAEALSSVTQPAALELHGPNRFPTRQVM